MSGLCPVCRSVLPFTTNECQHCKQVNAAQAEHATLRAKLAEAERQRDEAVKLLREWQACYRDADTPDFAERTEAYLAGVSHE